MKKTELKIGVEYAVTMRPQRGRRTRYSVRDTVFKATYVREGRVEREVEVVNRELDPKTNQYVDKGTRTDTAFDRGLVVKLPKPVKREGYDVYDRVRHDGSADISYSSRGERKRVTYTVEEIALENAGCFVSTWEEYEEAERLADESARREKARRREALAAAVEAEPGVKARLAALIEKLTEQGFVVELERHYGGEPGPDYAIRLEGESWDVGEIPVQRHFGSYGRHEVNPLTGFRLELKNEEAVTRLLGLEVGAAA
jgi:hypothetical protein